MFKTFDVVYKTQSSPVMNFLNCLAHFLHSLSHSSEETNFDICVLKLAGVLGFDGFFSHSKKYNILCFSSLNPAVYILCIRWIKILSKNKIKNSWKSLVFDFDTNHIITDLEKRVKRTTNFNRFFIVDVIFELTL